MTNRLRVMVLCRDGTFQRFLIDSIAREFHLAGVVLHERPHSRPRLATRIVNNIRSKGGLRHLYYRSLMSREYRYEREAVQRHMDIDNVPPVDVDTVSAGDVNETRVLEFLKECAPDVVVVNGTNLLRDPILMFESRVPYGFINLHTGLSPYTRGGNCNLHALLEGRPEWVGATVHHIDRGIDSGDIILSRRPDLASEDLFETIEAKTFKVGISMVSEALHRIHAGTAERVPQWQTGRLYLRRTGHVYDPRLVVQCNRKLRKGLISDYLADKQRRDEPIRLVGEMA